MRDILFSRTRIPAVMQSMQAARMRSEAATENIANISTPGYRRREVEFESLVRQSMRFSTTGKRTDEDHLPIGRKSISDISPQLVVPRDNNLYSGVNNVDIDREMAVLADAQILHNFNVKFLSSQYQRFKTAISGNVR